MTRGPRRNDSAGGLVFEKGLAEVEAHRGDARGLVPQLLVGVDCVVAGALGREVRDRDAAVRIRILTGERDRLRRVHDDRDENAAVSAAGDDVRRVVGDGALAAVPLEARMAAASSPATASAEAERTSLRKVISYLLFGAARKVALR